LLNDIKAKLPFNKKKNDKGSDGKKNSSQAGQDETDPGSADLTGAIENTDLGDGSQTFVNKLKAKVTPKTNKKESEDPPKKKGMNPVILIIVVVGLGFFILYEEKPQEAAPTKAPENIAKPDAPVVVEPTTPEPIPDAPVVDTPTADPVEPPATPEPIPDAPVVDTPPVDPVEPPTTPEPIPDAPVVDTPNVDPVDPTTTPEPTPDSPVVDTPVIDPVDPTITPEPPVTTDPFPDGPGGVEPTVENPTDPPIPVPEPDSVDGKVTNTEDNDMTNKILEDLEKQVKKDQPKEVKKEYVSPPDYEYKGRGLVYNCAGKHWACIDGPSYKNCEDNFSSTTFKKKTIECYPFNIFDSQKGCELMQNRVVSSNAKTAFCKGN